MKTHSLTRPFAHCSRARSLLSPPLCIQNKSRTSNKVVVRLLMELDLPSRTGAGTKRPAPPRAQSPKVWLRRTTACSLLRRRSSFFLPLRIYDCAPFIISRCQTFLFLFIAFFFIKLGGAWRNFLEFCDWPNLFADAILSFGRRRYIKVRRVGRKSLF